MAGRPADAAAGDTHRDEALRGERSSWFLQVLARHCKWAAAETSGHLLVLTVTCLRKWSPRNSRLRLQRKASKVERERELWSFGPGNLNTPV